MGHMGSMENSYYKIKSGTLHKRMQMYGLCDSISKKEKKKAEYAAGMYWTTKKIGKKKVSYDDCQKWMKNFTASHKKIKVKYYKNTAKNISFEEIEILTDVLDCSIADLIEKSK